jgi:tetratricopeptide (TPR) repeat protein
MGSGAADIAEVVSDVRERLPDLKPSPKLDDPEQARFRLFDSITAFLKSASRKQPLVVILDNLHWADKPSLLLIEFLAPELTGSRLLVIGTYRDVDLSRKHPLTETLGELTKERLFQRVLLRGLSEDDVGRFIEFVSGIRPPAGLVKAVHQQTEGNPLFMTEVVRLLVQEGELTQERVKDRDSWSVRIPEGVREVIGRRLNRLSARCNEALTIAAMIGREFELRQLRRLVEDTSEDRLLEVLEEALSARLIEELPRVVGRYQFSHALVRQTLEEELSTTRRVRLHARVAEALEESYGGNAEAHASELAYHFAEAESVLGTEKLVKYSTLAGEQALARYAYEDALAHFQRALAAKEGEPMDAETAGLWFGLGRAQLATRTLEEMHITLASLTRAFDYYASVNDVERAVAVAGLLLPGGNPRGWGDLIARALKLVAPDSHEAGRLLANHGVIIGNFSPNYQGAQEAFSLALAIARREGDIALEVQTLANASLVDWRHMRWQDSLAKGLRVIELTRRASNPPSEMRARTAIIQSLRTMGKLTEAKTHAAAQLATAEKVRERQWLLRALENNTEIAILEGDFQAARIISERRLGTGSRYQMGLSVRALLEYQLGEFAQAQAYFARMRELLTSVEPVSVSPIAMSVALAGRITEDSSYLQVAESIAQDLLNTSRRDPHATHHCKTALALIAIQRDNPDAAGEQYEAIKDIPGIMIWIGAQSDHVLGLLAHTMGQLNKAAKHFEDALAFCRKAGYRPELAWSLCDYADVLRERASTGSAQASPGDRQKAMSLLDESLRISRELGMRPLMERVLSRREILKA